MKLKKNMLVRVLRGSYKGKIEAINEIKKNYVTLKNILGLSSKKKPFFVKINKSNIGLVK